MSVRVALAAFAVLTLVACAADQVQPRERLKFERTTRSSVYDRTSRPARAAEGNVFVIVHLTEDPARKEKRFWLHSVMEDWDGRKYRASFTGVTSGSSSRISLFGLGPRREIPHPDRIQLVFEVPQTAVLRRVTVPEPISLSEAPVKISDVRSAPKAVHRVEPGYPDAALRRGIAGLVKLEVLAMPDGTVAGARHIHGPAILGEAAAEAVRQWRFEPHVVDGKAVPALFQVQVDFRADHPLTNTFAR